MQSNPGRPGRSPAAGSVAVIAALTSERRALERGAAASADFAIYQSGPGAAAAAAAAQRAVADGAERLVSWGLAGGLSVAAVTGTVVLPDRIVGADLPPIAVDADWRRRLQALIGGEFDLLGGDLATTHAALTSPAAKREAAALGAIAVDMESRAIAEVAASAVLPFVAVRIIVDGADDALPDGVARFVDAAGDVRPLVAVVSALRSPAELRLLLSLGRKSARAHEKLTRLASVLANDRFGRSGSRVGASS